MLGIEYVGAFIKIAVQIAFSIVSAIPMRIAWNCVASNYLDGLIPARFVNISYWHFVAILLIITLLGETVQKLTPKIVSVSQNVESKEN